MGPMQESSFPLSMGSKTCGAGWKNFPSLPPPTPLPHIFLISLTRVGSNLFLPSFCLCFPRYTSHVLPPFVSCDCLKLQLFDFSALFDFPPLHFFRVKFTILMCRPASTSCGSRQGVVSVQLLLSSSKLVSLIKICDKTQCTPNCHVMNKLTSREHFAKINLWK